MTLSTHGVWDRPPRRFLSEPLGLFPAVRPWVCQGRLLLTLRPYSSCEISWPSNYYFSRCLDFTTVSSLCCQQPHGTGSIVTTLVDVTGQSQAPKPAGDQRTSTSHHLAHPGPTSRDGRAGMASPQDAVLRAQGRHRASCRMCRPQSKATCS